jgi:hypothetical protein
MSAKKGNLLLSIVNEKCPNCGKAHVFKKKETFFQLPVMKERCELCSYRFDREPGYFLGAMYLSYGLAVFQGLITFLIFYFVFPAVPVLYVAFTIVGMILLFSIKNFKLSRVIYIHIFPW